MDGKKLTTRDFIARVDELAKPEDLAFPHNGNGHVYSGPHRDVLIQYVPILGKRISNKKRAIKRAKPENELLIDYSAPARFLSQFKVEGMSKEGVYIYFKEISELSDFERKNAGDVIWSHTSKKFINALWGDVSTTVCGADRKRVFYTVEIPYMMAVVPQLLEKMQKTKDIEKINLFPTTIFRTAFSAISTEKAYKYFCLTEQRKVLRRALGTGEKDVYADYLDTLEMYNLDKRRKGIVGKHPLNVLNPQERKAWKESEMTRFANRTLKRIDDVLGVRPKQLLTKMPFIKPVGPALK